MCTGSGRCLIVAMQMASDYLPRLARAARRVQGPRRGTFRKLDPGAATALAKVTGVIVTARVRLRAAAGCEAPPP